MPIDSGIETFYHLLNSTYLLGSTHEITFENNIWQIREAETKQVVIENKENTFPIGLRTWMSKEMNLDTRKALVYICYANIWSRRGN